MTFSGVFFTIQIENGTKVGEPVCSLLITLNSDDVDTLRHVTYHVTLTFEPLTLNICSVSLSRDQTLYYIERSQSAA